MCVFVCVYDEYEKEEEEGVMIEDGIPPSSFLLPALVLILSNMFIVLLSLFVLCCVVLCWGRLIGC